MKQLGPPSGARLPECPELSPARRRLFDASLGLFSQHGYNGVSVRDIARELQQQPTAIYAHVGSKQELLHQLVKIGDEELRDRIRAALLEAGSDPIDQVRAIVAANARTHLTFPELARVSHREYDHLSPQQRAVTDVLRLDLGALLRDVIRRGIAQGVFSPPDFEVTLFAIVSMGVRVVDWWAVDLGVDVEQVAASHAELAVRMLAPGHSR